MPRIPTYTAEGGAIPVQFAPVPVVPKPAADPGAVLRQLGTEASDIANRLDRHQGDLEALDLAAKYDAGILLLRQQVFSSSVGPNGEAVPAPSNPEGEFVKRAQDLQRGLLKSTERTDVQAAVQSHFNRTFPKSIIEVHFDQLKALSVQQLARLDMLGDTYAKSAAEAPTPESRDTFVATFMDAVDRTPSLNPLEKQQMKRKFEANQMQRNMNYVRLQDPYKVLEMDRQGAWAGMDPVTHEAILRQTNADIDRKLTTAEHNFNEAKRIVGDAFDAKVNYGLATEQELADIAEGRNPYIPAHKAPDLEKRNATPPFPAGQNKAVHVIMWDYFKSNGRVADTERARAALVALQEQSDRQEPEIAKALKDLQAYRHSAEAADRAIRGEGRAERGVAVSEKALAIAAGIREYEAAVPAPPVFQPSFMRQADKNREAANKAEIRARVWKGEDPTAVAQEIIKRNQSRVPIPQKSKDMREMAR